MLSHATGVEQDRVCVFGVVGQLVASLTEAGNYHFAVKHIHLATNRFDVQLMGHDRTDVFLKNHE